MNPELPHASLSRLQRLLLDLLSPCRSVRQADLDALTTPEWERLWVMVHQHRLGPLLGWQLAHAHAHLVLSSDISARLAQTTRQTVLRSLLLQQELIGIHRVLVAAGIPYQALKGAFLAFHAYPHPSLRPMRDLDIVVPRKQALAAYQALQAAGLSRVAEDMTAPEVAMAVHHHLAPLRARCGQFPVELHYRLFHFRLDKESGADPSDEPEFWLRGRHAALGGESVSFESPEDLLLHLIVHAVYDHEFSNGPLLLSDVAFLLRRHAVDWDVFWARARETGRTRGCQLVMHLVQRYWGSEGLPLPPAATASTPPSDAELDDFATLMLCDVKASLDRGLHGNFAQVSGALAMIRYLLGRAFAPRAQLRAAHALPADDWRVIFYYPVRWHRQLTEQVPKLWRARGGDFPQQVEVRQLGALRRWLVTSR
jgi:hypothetical protein